MHRLIFFLLFIGCGGSTVTTLPDEVVFDRTIPGCGTAFDEVAERVIEPRGNLLFFFHRTSVDGGSSAHQIVFYLTVEALSNDDCQPLTLDEMYFRVSGKLSSGQINWVAHDRFAGGKVIGSGLTTKSFSIFPDTVLRPGESREYVITMDTSHARENDTLSVCLDTPARWHVEDAEGVHAYEVSVVQPLCTSFRY